MCNHDQFSKARKAKKKVIDLKFMKNGIKKWIVEYHGGGFRCHNCKSVFTPKNLSEIPKFGNNLMIWSVNQHITYRVSLLQTKNMIQELFNIQLSTTKTYEFKYYLSKEYKKTFMEIQQTMIKGSLIHVDETTVSIQGIDRYVWVFSTFDSVFYLYRPNREADFLKELLKGFNGVLVSDFYTGYDSLPCPQQKCLIHLLRDLDDDLFKNQLDIEYKSIITEFGKLLITIINTIDKYGLKKRHLNKHNKNVEKFYNRVIDKEYESELAMKYVKKFKKYRNKLFTFLNYNGIPWNNSNAETAIRFFSMYRTLADGRFTENSIDSYLIFLSIQQTCKLRGVSFLDFLKSRVKSINEYYKKF